MSSCKKKYKEETHPSGCCRTEASSSTAVEAAIDARPGRVTVHISSSVLSVRDCGLDGQLEYMCRRLSGRTSAGATMSLQ